MKYPRDYVDDLLSALREADKHHQQSRTLPDAPTLAALLDIAFAASVEPDEGRFATFGLAFIQPDEERTGFKQLRFGEPLDCSTREVVKLAAAIDSTRTSLAVWREASGALKIWGLVTSESQSLASSAPDGHPAFLFDTPFFLIRARAPGVLYVYHWQELHLLYVRGQAYFRPPSGQLQVILREARLDPGDAQALSQIAARISLLGHGGTLLVTSPGAELPAGLLDIPYRFDPPSPALRDAVRGRFANLLDPRSVGIERHALDFVSQLSQIDGAIHLTADLVVHGFGATIRAGTEHFRLVVDGAGTEELALSAIPGTRHRSAAMFCAQQPGQALAIVISQDGDVSLFERLPDGSIRRTGPFALGAGLAVGG